MITLKSSFNPKEKNRLLIHTYKQTRLFKIFSANFQAQKTAFEKNHPKYFFFISSFSVVKAAFFYFCREAVLLENSCSGTVAQLDCISRLLGWYSS